MLSGKDTIVACSSPPGRGAISVIRLSGDKALSPDILIKEIAPLPGGDEQATIVSFSLSTSRRMHEHLYCRHQRVN